jgi:hypothetical protein
LPLPHDPGPHWGEVGIHGLHRQREWDAVVTVAAPELAGDELWLVALADGRVVVEEGGGDAASLVQALGRPAPYRAHAVRRSERIWAVAVQAVETVQLESDPGGTFVELVWDGIERSVRIDDAPTLVGIPELERLGAERHDAYVVTASRLVDAVWEVGVAPL